MMGKFGEEQLRRGEGTTGGRGVNAEIAGIESYAAEGARIIMAGRGREDMTKTRLEQLKALKLEVRLLQEELNNLPQTRDCVKGSMTEFPYIQRTIQIEGTDEVKGAAVRRRLDEKLAKFKAELNAVETWLEEIEDGEMRAILRMRYQQGLTQAQIGDALGYDRSVISRRLNKFWCKN